MERIRNLNGYQKFIILLLIAMAVIFAFVYLQVSSRVGFEYMDEILCPSVEGGSTVYSGKIKGQEAIFTVTPDKTVTFTYGNRSYGTFIAKEDPTAVPEDHDYMTGVEIRRDDEIFFRGGVTRSGENLMLIDEDGSFGGFTVFAHMSDGTVIDMDGNVADVMAPSASAILRLMEGPELTHKGQWYAWILGVFVSVVTALSILFVDELFRFNLSFQIRDAYGAEPSDWEIAGRYIGWTMLPIMALVLYITGLK